MPFPGLTVLNQSREKPAWVKLPVLRKTPSLIWDYLYDFCDARYCGQRTTFVFHSVKFSAFVRLSQHFLGVARLLEHLESSPTRLGKKKTTTTKTKKAWKTIAKVTHYFEPFDYELDKTIAYPNQSRVDQLYQNTTISLASSDLSGYLYFCLVDWLFLFLLFTVKQWKPQCCSFDKDGYENHYQPAATSSNH